MTIKTDIFQDACKKILDAVDSSKTVGNTGDYVELEAHGRTLTLNATNKIYYVSVIISLDEDTEFHAVVGADLFLNLISKITTKELDLSTTANALIIKGNGNYKIPLIYDGEKLVELPKITINNVTSSFAIENTILQSILKYNSKELLKSGLRKAAKRSYYIDEKGAITFTVGACVNSFSLAQPIKFVLNEKIVKLFKLFKSESVDFSLGYDEVSGGLVQTKVSFKTADVVITTILDTAEEPVSKFPVDAIRRRADEIYSFSASIDKTMLLNALSRLSLFGSTTQYVLYTYLKFGQDGVTVYDTKKDNFEVIPYANSIPSLTEEYETILETGDLILTLESCDEQYITLGFGNHQAIVIARDTIKNIMPECSSAN